MQTSASFTQQDGLFIDANLHQFIEQQYDLLKFETKQNMRKKGINASNVR